MKKIVLVSCFGWYEKRLQFVREYFIRQNYEVHILSANWNHEYKEKITRQNSTIQYLEVPEYKKNLSFKRIYSHCIFAKRAYAELVQIKPDVIYAVMPPNYVGWYCIQYKKQHRQIKLIADLIDLWPESLVNDKKRLSRLGVMKYWKRLRTKCLKEADCVISECQYYLQKIYENAIPRNSHVLYLCKEKGKEPEYDIALEEGIELCYLGSINNIIDIDLICEIVHKISTDINKKVSMHIIGDGESRQEFIDKVNKECEVIYHGRIYDDLQKKKIMSSCMFGLNVMKSSVCVGVTTKSIDYMEAGLPIINNINGDTWDLVEQKEIGINYNLILENDFSNYLGEVEDKRRKAYQCYCDLFSVDAIKKQLKNIFENI